MNETAIQTALDATAIFMQNKEERIKYLNREMAIIDYESEKEAWIDEGKLEVIRAMIKKGFDNETISSVTSWDVDNIINVREKMKE